MRKRFLLLLIKACLWLLLFAGIIIPADNNVIHINIKADYITTDNLGNFYSVFSNTIKKYNATGSLIGEFTFKRFDRFDDTDPSDPLKILLFSKTYGEIIRLDSKLSLLGEPLSLMNIGILSPATVCNSWDNGIWVYDMSLNEILRINNNGVIDQRSGGLDQIMPAGSNPAMIRELDFMIYISIPRQGIFIFDRYANFIIKLPLEDIGRFQIAASRVLYVKNNDLIAYDTKTFLQNSIPLPVNNPLSAALQVNNLYIHHSDTISIYSINTNP